MESQACCYLAVILAFTSWSGEIMITRTVLARQKMEDPLERNGMPSSDLHERWGSDAHTQTHMYTNNLKVIKINLFKRNGSFGLCGK